MYTLILGNISFEDKITFVHSVDKTETFETKEEAIDLGEEECYNYGGYVVVEVWEENGGKIIYEEN